MEPKGEVVLVEVGPRDGLQNEKKALSTDDKFEFIERLEHAGCKIIEVTSFVRSDRIPQMGDARELISRVNSKFGGREGMRFPCLVPNEKGLEMALSAGVKDMALFTSTSDKFNLKNINMDVDKSLKILPSLVEKGRKGGIRWIRGYISTAFGCPYEGKTSVETLKKVLRTFFELGVDEVSIGDTIGVAHPLQVKNVIDSFKGEFDVGRLAMHFHDTWGRALANVWVSFQEGFRIFDSSAGGLGGCPYAKGATGNVATEDVLQLFLQSGVGANIDMERLSQASIFVLGKLSRETTSKCLKAYLAQRTPAKGKEG